MGRRVFVLGGTGQIGRALVPLLLSHGWEVTAAARHRASPVSDLDVRFIELDRDEGLDLRDDFDAVVDVVPYTPEHARQLLRLGAGAIVAISSASVYTDAEGRTLDEAKDEKSFPQFPVPIPETQATVTPSDATYSTQKSALERTLLEQDETPAIVVRPCAVYGPGGEFAREQFFVKRILDGRRYVVLPVGGRNVFHPTSVHNIAELIRVALDGPRSGVFNCGDPDPPSTLEIGRVIARVLDHQWMECLLPGAAVDGVGRTPWGRFEAPIVLDVAKAEMELGYRPAVAYPEAVAGDVPVDRGSASPTRRVHGDILRLRGRGRTPRGDRLVSATRPLGRLPRRPAREGPPRSPDRLLVSPVPRGDTRTRPPAL